MTASDRAGDPGLGSGLVRAEFDWASTAPCMAVIETVAVASDREPTALEPLYETVDPDALDALVRSKGARSSEGVTSVSFRFDGHDVTVQSDGGVVVRPLDPE